MKASAVSAAMVLLVLGRAFCDVSDWDEVESKREASYESYGRASGVRSHKWKLALSQKWGAKAGMVLVKNESPALSAETHMLGLYGSRNFRRAGFRAGCALRDRSLSGGQGKNFLSGGLRLTPFQNMDFLLDYDRVQEEFVTGEDDLEKETLSAGFRLKANAFRINLNYAGQNLLRVKVSYGW